MAKMNITGLQPATTYYYAVQSNGVVDNSSDDIGRFTTPAAGAFSYTFTVGSCAVNSNHQVYTAIQNKNPLFHLTTGDFHYANPNSTNINTHRVPYENNMLSQTPTRNLFKNTALAYMWDDHDYCGDNSSGAATGQANARQAYQEYVPHYPLVAGSGNVPIYQAFTIGRVRFILADLRSVRSSGTMMGTTQKAWFKNECINAKNNGQIIAWISSVSFGGNTSDNWGGFSAERTELSNFFRDNSIANLFVLSGDAHMVAIDNGTNHDFSTGNNNPNDYPVFQAAAINNSGSTKGGTYSEGGTFPNNSSSNGQYGVVEVTDNGGSTIQIKFTAYRTAGNTTSESVLTSYTFSRTLGLQPASFSVRTVPQSQSVITSWSHAGEPLVLEKSRNGNTYKKLMNISHQQGDYEDKDAVNGWNHYRLKNKEGKIVSEKSVFVSGSTSLSLFPNPAKSQVNVMLKEVPQAINSRYMVYNDKMKTQLQGNLALQKGKNTFPLDISTLLPGIYYLHIVLQGAELTQKLVVQ
jgi:alkaline phosphatase D